MSKADDDVLGVEMSAKLLGVPVVTMYRWLDQGQIEEASGTNADGSRRKPRRVHREVIEQLRRSGELPFARPADLIIWRRRTGWTPPDSTPHQGES